MTLNCLQHNLLPLMFESILSAVLPIVKDLLWTACAALLAYMVNKLTNQFT